MVDPALRGVYRFPKICFKVVTTRHGSSMGPCSVPVALRLTDQIRIVFEKPLSGRSSWAPASSTTQADIARREGITLARVTQFMSLLRLPQGDPGKNSVHARHGPTSAQSRSLLIRGINFVSFTDFWHRQTLQRPHVTNLYDRNLTNPTNDRLQCDCVGAESKLHGAA